MKVLETRVAYSEFAKIITTCGPLHKSKSILFSGLTDSQSLTFPSRTSNSSGIRVLAKILMQYPWRDGGAEKQRNKEGERSNTGECATHTPTIR